MYMHEGLRGDVQRGRGWGGERVGESGRLWESV
jgi:hypothetical protein